MMRIVTIVGARPQFVKAAMVSRAIAGRAGVTEVIVHTGQHYDRNMSGVFFEEMGIPRPAYELSVGSGTHGRQTAKMLEGVEEIMLADPPDWVLVYGDTNSTLAGALAAAKMHIRIAHVEAGLRSFDRQMPEETNRVLTDHMADLLFVPTIAAVRNLAIEGIAGRSVKLVGDIMYDAVCHFGQMAEQTSSILSRLGLSPHGYVLGTVHRACNTDDPRRLEAIVRALSNLASLTPVVLPLHPRTRDAMRQWSIIPTRLDRLLLVDPVSYLDMLTLEKNSRMVVTDSGGVQKEAFFFGVPCATLREQTEWTELVELGWNHLVPPLDELQLTAGLRAALSARPGQPAAPYGDGHTADRILGELLEASS